MDINISYKDKIRVYSDFERTNFVDVAYAESDGIAVSLQNYRNFIEIRKKELTIVCFVFKDFTYFIDHIDDWWKDAEIIWKNY